jgi:hypothetical protein
MNAVAVEINLNLLLSVKIARQIEERYDEQQFARDRKDERGLF